MPLQQTSGGSLLLTGAALANECCCEPPVAPCTCAEADPGIATQSFAIQGYVDSFFDLSGCVECVDADGSYTPWNGIFTPTDGVTCQWGVGAMLSYSGKIMTEAVPIDQYLTLGFPIACAWNITLTCSDIFPPPQPTWTGVKLTGLNPTGIYTRTGGCSPGPATLTII